MPTSSTIFVLYLARWIGRGNHHPTDTDGVKELTKHTISGSLLRSYSVRDGGDKVTHALQIRETNPNDIRLVVCNEDTVFRFGFRG